MAMGIGICPKRESLFVRILRPVFVLWFEAFPAEETVSRDSGADQSISAGGSVSTGGVVTSTTLEGDETPEPFHA